MFNLKITAPASEILKNQISRNFLKKVIGVLLRFLEKYFGAGILIDIPSQLQNLDPQILKAVNVASEIQSLGIINNIKKRQRYFDEPFLYNYYALSINKAFGVGVDFFNEANAFWKSLAEATERYLWLNSDDFLKKRVQTSYKKIKSRSLNIFSLAGFSQKQKSEIPLLQFDENTVFDWVQSYSLIQKKSVFCPIQLISAIYFGEKVKTPENSKGLEPMLRWAITTGLATGQSIEEAIVKGILEIVERDAFMIAYMNKLSPPIIDLEHLSYQDEEIAKIIRSFKRYNLEIYILQLPTDFPVHINFAIIVDRTGLGPALTVGAGASFDFKTSFLAGVSEALTVRYSLKKKFRREIDLKNIDREERLIYWTRPENLKKIDFFFKGNNVKINIERNFYEVEKGKDYYREKLDILSKDLKRKHYETCYIELSGKKIKKLGFRCVNVVIPELQPMHLKESIPYFGGKRLKEIPLKFGYQAADVLNQEPHPFP